MLTELINAKIPLIQVTTDDLINIHFVLEALLEDYKVLPLSQTDREADVYFHIGEYKNNTLNDLYADAQKNNYSVVFVNTDFEPQMMNGGELLPDRPTINGVLQDNLPKALVNDATEALFGLSFQQIFQVIPLTTQYFDKLTVEHIRRTKDMLFLKQVGVVLVETETEYYFPVEFELMEWAETNRDYMFTEVDSRLTPKGILLHGETGTGKTEFSRFIAREWGLPLFLLDLNSMLTKWQGEAEHHLNKALQTFDKESPCVVLFDEVEKLFNSTTENDTSQRLLSRILWWLQYKTSNVLIVMTCNDMDVIPKELFRAGRIDLTQEMKGVAWLDVAKFIKGVLESFGATDKKFVEAVIKMMGNAINKTYKTEHHATVKGYTPQAVLTQGVVDFLKSVSYGL